MTIWFPCVDWTAVSSIAQVLGVIATFSAVIVAVRINKPRIKVVGKIMIDTSTKKTIFIISVLNLSNINVKITFTGISMRNKMKSFRGISVNKWLAVYDETVDTYNLSELKQLLNNGLTRGNIKKNDRIVVYAADSSGKYHYYKTKHTVNEVLIINE